MNDLLITNGKDIITHCAANINNDDDDAYTHTHVSTVAHVKNATQNEIWKIRLYRWYFV